MQFRTGTTADAKQIARCNKDNLPVSYTPEDYEYCCDSDTHDVVVAVEDGKVVGYVMGEHASENFHIMSFAVDEQYRKKKIGTRLIQHLLTSKLKQKIQTMTLYVHVENKPAIIFYMRNGFKIQKRIPNYYKKVFKDADSQDGLKMIYRR